MTIELGRNKQKIKELMRVDVGVLGWIEEWTAKLYFCQSWTKQGGPGGKVRNRGQWQAFNAAYRGRSKQNSMPCGVPSELT